MASISQKIKAIILMTRIYTTHIYIATIVSAALLAGNFDYTKIALMCVSVCSVLFFVNAANFYTDAVQDQLHPMTKSENPFTNKILNKSEAILISFFYVAVSLLIAIPLGLLWILAVVIYNIIALAYNFKPLRMKSHPFGWFLDASLSLPLTFLFPYLVLSPTLTIPLWIVVSLIMFYATFAMIVNKDVPDMMLDQSANDRTYPNVYGVNATRNLVIALSLVSFVCFLILAWIEVTSIYTLPIMALLTIWILRNVISQDIWKDRKLVYLKLNIFGIFLTPVVFMAGVIINIFF
ncbi:MAG: prenyltransferase [Candidatus Bathyarchaeota archaeon]|nr:MAG: prenyltransferase [Candidatus Bathyarchaeota archaeon]